MERFGKSSKAIFLGKGIALLVFAFASHAFANPTPKFVYVSNIGDNTISAYTIDNSTGALTPVSGSPFATGNTPISVAVDPTGQFAYVANTQDFTVSAYTIDNSTGALTPVSGSPYATGPYPSSVAVDPTGQFVYVANEEDGQADSTVSAYTIDNSTGALTPVSGSPFAAGWAAESVVVAPSGQFAYVANRCASSSDCSAANASTVQAYTIDNSTGALTPVSGSPFATGGEPISAAVNSSGQFAYVLNECASGACSVGNVSAYTINSSTGALTPVSGSPFAAGGAAYTVAADPSGPFAYVANSGDNTVSAYAISSTGALTPVNGSPFAAGNTSLRVAVDASGQFAYVVNDGDNTVSAYTINGSTGALTPVSGSPYATGNSPDGVAIAGQALTYLVTPTTVAFGSEADGVASASQSVTVTNTASAALQITSITLTGTNAGQFSETNTCGTSLAVGATCTISVVFSPTSTGAKTATLNVNSGGGVAKQKVSLTGTGIVPTYTVTPGTVPFGNEGVGIASAEQPITVTNTGSIAVPITSITLTGGNPTQFSQTNTCGTSVAVGNACTISVVFQPTSTGAKSATLKVNSGGGAATQTVTLSGTGIVPTYSLSPTSLAFGNQTHGTSSPAQSITLTNTGTLALPITSVKLTGANTGQFSETNTCGTSVAVGNSCTISVVFSPTSKGAKTANVSVAAGGGGGTQTVPLTGTGT